MFQSFYYLRALTGEGPPGNFWYLYRWASKRGAPGYTQSVIATQPLTQSVTSFILWMRNRFS